MGVLAQRRTRRTRVYARGGRTTGRNDRPHRLVSSRDISTGASSQTPEMLDPPVEQWGAPTPRHPSRWLILRASYWRGRCQARSVSLVRGGIRPTENRKVGGSTPPLATTKAVAVQQLPVAQFSVTGVSVISLPYDNRTIRGYLAALGSCRRSRASPASSCGTNETTRAMSVHR